MSYVLCKICGLPYRLLNCHIERVHNISVAEYKKRFPGASLTSSDFSSTVSEGQQRRFKDPKEREKVSEVTRSWWASKSSEEKSEALKNSFHSEESREAFRELHRNMTDEQKKEWVGRSFHNPEARKLAIERMQVGLKAWWASLSEEDKLRELEKRIHSSGSRAASNEGLRRRWLGLSDGEKYNHLMSSFGNLGQKQTFPEKVVETWLDENKPGEWKYTGSSREVCIGGKFPDFININGQKKVIEVFGTFWHPEEDIKDREEHYGKYGFKCIVLWDYDCLPLTLDSILSEV